MRCKIASPWHQIDNGEWERFYYAPNSDVESFYGYIYDNGSEYEWYVFEGQWQRESKRYASGIAYGIDSAMAKADDAVAMSSSKYSRRATKRRAAVENFDSGEINDIDLVSIETGKEYYGDAVFGFNGANWLCELTVSDKNMRNIEEITSWDGEIWFPTAWEALLDALTKDSNSKLHMEFCDKGEEENCREMCDELEIRW